MMVPHSLKVPLVELSFFDTGLYKLGSMRYMAEKTSTNVYRSVWVYLCISILFCIFHFQLKVDYFIDYQSSIFSHFRDPCNHAPTMAEPPPAVLGEKAFSGCDGVVDLSFVLLLLSTFLLFFVVIILCVRPFSCGVALRISTAIIQVTWRTSSTFTKLSSTLAVQRYFPRILFPIKIFGSPDAFCQNTFPNQNIDVIKSSGVLPEYFCQKL